MSVGSHQQSRVSSYSKSLPSILEPRKIGPYENAFEEKKDDEDFIPSCPISPLQGIASYRNDVMKQSSLSPDKTATTVFTTASSSAHYSALRVNDLAPCAGLSPDHVATVESRLSTLPIPLPSEPSPSNVVYFRVTFRGVVALLQKPDRQSPRSGVYLSYAEVFASQETSPSFPMHDSKETTRSRLYPITSLPPRQAIAMTGSSFLSLTRDKPSDIPLHPLKSPSTSGSLQSSLPVLFVMTGGYANEQQRFHSHIDNTYSHINSLGFLFPTSTTGEVIAERIDSLSSSIPPIISSGPWTYKIVSSSPVPILTGPCLDAPCTAAMLLPGSIHQISLCYDNFLRLSHRRGWISAFKQTKGGGRVLIPAAQLVRIEMDHDTTTSATEGGLLTSAVNASIASYGTNDSSSSLHTTGTTIGASRQRQQRHRPPRRWRARDKRGDDSVRQGVPSRNADQCDDKSNLSLLSDEGESSEQSLSHTCRKALETVYLMRVLHPKGLKILDAPQFAASHLIHGHGRDLHHHPHYSSAQPHKVFSTLPTMRSNPVVVFDSHTKTRRLPSGVFFEARSLLQHSALHEGVAGLIQLLDKTGWVMVPSPADVEMMAQSALGTHECIRVMTRSGLPVICSPPSPLSSSTGNLAAPQSPHSTPTNNDTDSDVASSVSSAFLDVFRTSTKNPASPQRHSNRPSNASLSLEQIIPCGTAVQVEKSIAGSYARLLGHQGWIAKTLQGKKVCEALSFNPENRTGSFWFRVQASKGVRVRVGPSRRAPSITMRDDKSCRQTSSFVRFECGEFLRASEIVTIRRNNNTNDEIESTNKTVTSECFCKLYRNRHDVHQPSRDRYRSIASFTTPSEWVQVYHGDELFLEECAEEPRIERHKQGGSWKYHVLHEVIVRKGPSLASESIGHREPGTTIAVSERVAPAGDINLKWLRLIDGQGWVHDTCHETGITLIVSHSLRHNHNKPKLAGGGKGEIAYSAIIARLFHNDASPFPRSTSSVRSNS